MRRAILGNTGIPVTELGHGTLIFGWLQAQLPPEAGAAALRRSYELGVRFIDTAQLYKSYPHVRRFLDEVRPSDVTLASKSHAKTKADMRAAVDECLRELNRDHIDIFHMHALTDADDLRSRQGAVEALIECRRQGKIRAIGMTTHSVEGFKAIRSVPEIEVVHPILNRNSLGLIKGTTEELLTELRALRAQGRGAYAMKIFAGGHYIRDMEKSLAYVRGLGLVDAMAVGMKTPEEVEMDVRLFETGRLTDADRKTISTFRKKLVIYDRCKRCGKCVKACQQDAMRLGEKKAENDPAKCVLCGYCAEACPDFMIRVV